MPSAPIRMLYRNIYLATQANCLGKRLGWANLTIANTTNLTIASTTITTAATTAKISWASALSLGLKTAC